MIVIRTKRIVYQFQSRNANRDDYNNDSNVKIFFLKNWFANINWLKLKLSFNMFIIQTNRCFIKSKIRDLSCIRRFFFEIFNDYCISLIKNLFVIFTIFEIKICEIFLITSFDAYIEICLLKFEHQCRTIVFLFLIWIVANRLFDFDLNRYRFRELKSYNSKIDNFNDWINCIKKKYSIETRKKKSRSKQKKTKKKILYY